LVKTLTKKSKKKKFNSKALKRTPRKHVYPKRGVEGLNGLKTEPRMMDL
jgi:hypothetical protein